MAKDNNYNVGAVLRAVDIIEYLYRKDGTASINEISSDLGMHKSTVHRILNTLKSKEYIFQSEGDSKYHLGLRFYTIGALVKEHIDVFKIFTENAQNLVDKYHEGFQLSVIDTNSLDVPKVVTVQQVYAEDNLLSITPAIGIPVYGHCSSSGKCLLAFLDDDSLARYKNTKLIQKTPNSITDWNTLEKELAKVRTDGYATDNEEYELGLTCIAVPVYNAIGEVAAAISIQGPTVRVNSIDVGELYTDLKTLANKLTPYVDVLHST